MRSYTASWNIKVWLVGYSAITSLRFYCYLKFSKLQEKKLIDLCSVFALQCSAMMSRNYFCSYDVVIHIIWTSAATHINWQVFFYDFFGLLNFASQFAALNPFWNTEILQGRAATRLRCGRKSNDEFTAKFYYWVHQWKNFFKIGKHLAKL